MYLDEFRPGEIAAALRGTARAVASEKLCVVNWNVGGAKFLALPLPERTAFRTALNESLARLCAKWRPDIVLLQEVTRVRRRSGEVDDLVVAPPGYHYRMAPLHDSVAHSHPVRWNRYRTSGGRAPDDYVAQGSGFLWRDGLAHASLWDYAATRRSPRLACEVVPIETGLFTGDRDTEPRAAVVTHFVLPERFDTRHVFIVNVHLSTLHGERAGHPPRDRLGTEVRRRQLRTVIEGIVARHVGWSQLLEPPIEPGGVMWLVGGDFNAPPGAPEMAQLVEFGFVDANPAKGPGNKTSGLGNLPSHTVDYLFANYLEDWPQVRPAFARAAASNPEPDLSFRASDHYPTVARLPLLAGTARGARP